jgi:hypothetical protein
MASQHIVSHTMLHHKDVLEEKAKKNNDYAIAHKKGLLSPFTVKSEATAEGTGKCCYGCKSFYAKPCYWPKHIAECTKKEEHLKFLKSVLPDAVELKKAEESIAPESDQVAKLLLRIQRLEKENKELKDELKYKEEDAEEECRKLSRLGDAVTKFLPLDARIMISDYVNANLDDEEDSYNYDHTAPLLTSTKTEDNFRRDLWNKLRSINPMSS